MPEIKNRLTNRAENGLPYLVKVKKDEQEIERSFPNTLKAILESFQRLADYEDAEEQGLLIKLPCKVGSLLELRVGKKTQQYRLMGIIQQKGYLPMLIGRQQFGCFQNVPIALASEFGKTVFLIEEDKESTHD